MVVEEKTFKSHWQTLKPFIQLLAVVLCLSLFFFLILTDFSWKNYIPPYVTKNLSDENLFYCSYEKTFGLQAKLAILKMYLDMLSKKDLFTNLYWLPVWPNDWIRSCSVFVDDEGMKCVKWMILYSRNIDIIYPKIDADLVAGSGLNNGD